LDDEVSAPTSASDGGWRLTYDGLLESAPTKQAAQPARTIPLTAPALPTTIEIGAQQPPDPAPSIAATPPTPKKSSFTNTPPWAP